MACCQCQLQSANSSVSRGYGVAVCSKEMINQGRQRERARSPHGQWRCLDFDPDLPV